jgi:hypothetical protein
MGDMLGRSLALSYQPYQAYPGQRLEDFSGLQNQSFGIAAGMQVPGQYGQGTNFANQAGIGALNPGRWTDPGTSQSYMSPYMQNVVDIQNQELARTGQIQRNVNQAQAVKAGAYGGSRHGIIDAEQQRNLMQQMNQNQLTGLQSAYQSGMGQYNADRNAQQAGYGVANQSAGILGQLGQGQITAQSGIAQLQNQFGGQQQALGQMGRDIDYQNFQNQIQQPYNNLQFANSMIRGYPMQGTTSSVNTMEEGRPSWISQLTGAGLTGLSLWNMFGDNK